MSEMSLFEKRHVNLNKLRNFLSNTASADLIRKFEAELVIGFFDCVEVDAQSPPVAQVEVYRKALEECRAALYGCRELVGQIGNVQHAIDLADKALLTSKPEPVAPVRELQELVSEMFEIFDEDSYGCDCGTNELGTCFFCRGQKVNNEFKDFIKTNALTASKEASQEGEIK